MMKNNTLRILLIGALVVILTGSGVLLYNFYSNNKATVSTTLDKNDLYQAIITKDTDIYTKYIDDGADLSFAFQTGPDKGKTPLELLIQENDLMNAQKLMDNGFDLAKVDNNHMDTITSLISYNHDFNTPMIDDIAITLIDQVKGEIENDDSYHYSLLINAITTNDKTVIDEILKYITHIDKVYNDETALSYACILGIDNLDVIQELVDKGGDINYKGNEGDNCLMSAIAAGNDDIVEYIVGLPDLNINAVNDYGQTALHICVEYANVDALDILLQNSSIDKTKTDEDNLTAKEFAEEMLLQYPNDPDYTNIVNKL